MVTSQSWRHACVGAAILVASTVDPSAALDVPERELLVAAIAEQLLAEYVFPDVAAKLVDVLHAHAKRGDYASIQDGAVLAGKLTADLRAVGHDKHLVVEFHPEGARSADPAEERAQAERENFGFRVVERLDGNVGYLDFRSFADPRWAADTADAAMRFIARTDALIIDLRRNGGGEPAMVAFIASYLFDSRTHLNDIYLRRGDQTEQYWTVPVRGTVFGGDKPVYVLTSKTTFSAAEDLAYALQNLKRAVLVGETTAGAAHPTRAHQVSAHFVVDVPFARSLSPITHTDWEGAGVKPDVSVASGAARQTAYLLALQKIAASTPDAAHKRELKALLARLKRPARAP